MQGRSGAAWIGFLMVMLWIARFGWIAWWLLSYSRRNTSSSTEWLLRIIWEVISTRPIWLLDQLKFIMRTAGEVKSKTELCPQNLILPSRSSQVTQVTFYELCSQVVSGVDLKALLGESDYSEPHLREADTSTFYRSSYLDWQSNLHCTKTGDGKDQMLLLSKSVICYLFLHYLINLLYKTGQTSGIQK